MYTLNVLVYSKINFTLHAPRESSDIFLSHGLTFFSGNKCSVLEIFKMKKLRF